MVKLAKIFNVSLPTVRMALRGQTKTVLAHQIREAAKKNGAELYERQSRPNCETTFNTADKKITQTFGDRVKLIGDMETGDVTVYVDGKATEVYHNVTVQELAKIQATTAELIRNLNNA